MIKLIGYWGPDQQYPDPKKMQDPEFWKTRDRDAIIKHLKNGYPCNHYRGYSGCRICNQDLGTHERTDGVWCWPDKLEHYVKTHNVILPEDFIAHVTHFPKLLPYQIEVLLVTQGIKPYTEQDDLKFFNFHPDETSWVEWGKKWPWSNPLPKQKSAAQQAAAKMAEQIEKAEDERFIRLMGGL